MSKRLNLWFFLVGLLCSITNGVSGLNVDSMLHQIEQEDDPALCIEKIYALYSSSSETEPQKSIRHIQQVLTMAKKQHNKIAEAMALATIGASYRLMGNSAKGLEYLLNAMTIAEQTQNRYLLAYVKVNMGNIYRDRSDYARAINLYHDSENDARKAGAYKIESWNLGNLGICFFSENKLDSALHYSQMAYTICKEHQYHQFTADILTQLGNIQGKLGNADKAAGYFDAAIKEARKTNNPRFLNWAYSGLAAYYQDAGNTDSSIYYGRKAVDCVVNTAFYNMSIQPAKMLAAAYDEKNCDSALKYTEIYQAANDSLFNIQAIQQIQLMTFEESLRQQNAIAKKSADAEQRKHNLQYALIAIFITTAFVIYLIYGHRFITSTRWIRFIGIFALLLVFEFLNLLLHPFLQNITNDKPVLMMLSLIAIAALIVPAHHQIESWAINMLIEKNKRLQFQKK